MSGRVALIIAIGLFGVAIGCVALWRVILFLPHDEPLGAERQGSGLFGVVLLSFSLVGALIVSRYPGHTVGWIFCLTSPLTAFSGLTTVYAQYARMVPGSLPAEGLVGFLSGISYLVGFILPVTLGLLLFPDGRLPARRWLAVALLMPLGVTLMMIGATLAKVFGPPVPPVGVIGALVVLACVLGSVASLVYRWRRARGTERQQLKWVAAATTIIALALISLSIVEWLGVAVPADVPFAVVTAALSLFPISVGFAIVRHRLYDIDVLINRTLVYGTATAMLVATYAVAVILLQQVLGRFTAGNDIAIAASTLLIAALFQPLRRRIQDVVDLRFYRRKYDAAKTVDAFSARLRQEIDLDSLSRELLGVVHSAMQPRSSTLWVRGPRK